MRNFLAVLVLVAGCDIPTANLPFDDDGDGLLTTDEEALGTDPNNPDSDGDGYLDGDEVNQYTDPLDSTDHPYEAGWTINSCRNDTPSGDIGTAVGDIAANFALTDQFGETVHLYDFCDQAVLIESSAVWCPSCQASAPELETQFETYKDRGLMIITLLGEAGPEGAATEPSQTDLQDWVTAYGITYAVVDDDEWGVGWNYMTGSLPSSTLIAPGGVLTTVNGFDLTDSDIEAVLPQN